MSDFINEDIDANVDANVDANANVNEEEENITFDSLRKEWDMSEPEKLVKESQNTSEKIVWTIGIIIMVLVGSYYFRKRIKLGAEAFSELFDKTQLWMVSSILLLVSMFGYSNGEDPLPMLYIMVPVMIGVLILNEVLKKVIDIDIGTLSSSNTTLVSLLFLSIFCIVPTFFEVGVITPDNATLSLIWTFMIVASVFIVKGS